MFPMALRRWAKVIKKRLKNQRDKQECEYVVQDMEQNSRVNALSLDIKICG